MTNKEYWFMTIATSRHGKKAFIWNEITLYNPTDYAYNYHFEENGCDICILFAIKLKCKTAAEYKKIKDNWGIFNSVYLSD